MPIEVLLNGYHFMDPTTDFIKAGTTETWRWINLTVDAHPMHPHLVASQVVNRQAIDVDAIHDGLGSLPGTPDGTRCSSPTCGLPDRGSDPAGTGGDGLQGYREGLSRHGDEDKGQVHACLRRPSLDYDWKTKSFGSWVYHCHILEHEENDMMRPFEVVK